MTILVILFAIPHGDPGKQDPIQSNPILHPVESFLDIEHLYIEAIDMKNDPANKTQQTKGVHLWLLLWKATRTVERKAHASVREIGLGVTDFAILEALLNKGPLPVNAFRDKVLLTSGSLTAAVDRLERSGLVERVQTAKDRRTRIVHLTWKGRKLIGNAFQKHARDMECAFASFNQAERKRFAHLLRKLGHDIDNIAQKTLEAERS